MKEIFTIAANPLRVMELRAWITQNPILAQSMRGENNETLLHWTCMSDLGLSIDLITSGFYINALDSENRTPLEWLSDRIYYTCLHPNHRLTDPEARKKIKLLTESIALAIIPLGAKGSCIETWSRAGMWNLVQAELINQKNHIIDDKGFTPLHYFPIAAFENDQEVIDYMQGALKFGLDINAENKNGFSPLMVGVEQWLLGFVPDKRLAYMVENGADVYIENNFGKNCLDIVYQKSPEKVFQIQQILNLMD